eukprot:11591505-Alexandrium_andersonii.AAC.1
MIWPTGWAYGPSGKPPPADAGKGTRTPNQHMCPMPLSTSCWLSNSTMRGSCHNATEAGGWWRK